MVQVDMVAVVQMDTVVVVQVDTVGMAISKVVITTRLTRVMVETGKGKMIKGMVVVLATSNMAQLDQPTVTAHNPIILIPDLKHHSHLQHLDRYIHYFEIHSHSLTSIYSVAFMQ